MSSASVAVSVRARLLTVAKKRGEDYNLVLTRYVLERFLYRLSRSAHRDEMVLKGAMLFQVWGGAPHRSTRDLDLLAQGDVNPDSIAEKLTAICAVVVDDDGLTFDLGGLLVREIREESRYGGVRAKLAARLGTARIPMQIDFGVGDAVTPAATAVEYPTLLDMASPVVLAYPRATVVAEKLEAIVDLGMANSRMKDYFDLWFIATTFDDDPESLALAVRRTFERRGQPLPTELPIGLRAEFADDRLKQSQWKTFCDRTSVEAPSLTEVVGTIGRFVARIFEADTFSDAHRCGFPPR